MKTKLEIRAYDGAGTLHSHDELQLVLPIEGVLEIELERRGAQSSAGLAAFISSRVGRTLAALSRQGIGSPVTGYTTRDAAQRRLSRRLRTPSDKAPLPAVGTKLIVNASDCQAALARVNMSENICFPTVFEDPLEKRASGLSE